MSISIRTFLHRWDQGEFTASRESMCGAGWYDWFCTDKGLYSRLKKMVPALRRISRSEKINQDTMDVAFKNNCPCWADDTYDDFRISVIGTSNICYTIIPQYPTIRPGAPKKSLCYPRSDIVYVSIVWDLVVDENTKYAINMENLAQGKPVDHLEEVVHGTRKEMYAYFGV